MSAVGIIAVGALTSQANADEHDCVEAAAYTETIQHPAVTHTEQRMTNPGSAAIAAQHYSWNGGNRGVNDPPTVVPPHPDWQANTDFEPHTQGAGDPATWMGTHGVGLHVLGNSPSNASWFYFQPAVAAVAPTFETVTVVDKEAWTETINHAAVECPDIAGEETIVPKPKPKPDKPAAKPDKEPTVAGVQAVAPPAAAPAAAPTAVAAGFGSPESSPLQLIAQMLVAGGMLLLMAGAWIGLGRRESGTHEA